MIGFSGPRLGPPASISAVARTSPGSTLGGSARASRPVVAGSGPACPGTFHTTSPTAMPVAVSMMSIQRTEYRPMPRASGRFFQSTCWSCSAASLTPMKSRLAPTPTTSAGTIIGSRVRAGVVGAAGASCALSWATRSP